MIRPSPIFNNHSLQCHAGFEDPAGFSLNNPVMPNNKRK